VVVLKASLLRFFAEGEEGEAGAKRAKKGVAPPFGAKATKVMNRYKGSWLPALVAFTK
jgi:hypothetical protein